MGLKLHIGDNILKFHTLHAHIWPRTGCQKIYNMSVGFVSAALNLDPKTCLYIIVYPNTDYIVLNYADSLCTDALVMAHADGNPNAIYYN